MASFNIFLSQRAPSEGPSARGCPAVAEKGMRKNFSKVWAQNLQRAIFEEMQNAGTPFGEGTKASLVWEREALSANLRSLKADPLPCPAYLPSRLTKCPAIAKPE